MIFNRFNTDESLMVILSGRNHDKVSPVEVIRIRKIAVFSAAIIKDDIAENKVVFTPSDFPVYPVIKEFSDAIESEEIIEILCKFRPVRRQSVFIKCACYFSCSAVLCRYENPVII